MTSLGLTTCSEYLLYTLSETAPLSLYASFQSCPHSRSHYRPHLPPGRDAWSMPSVDFSLIGLHSLVSG
ncbi:hypothetical protein An04g07555 [Aspergillus niger]|uniref:Uncharacterized protein n=2 Tax=Aspergillus niger TaxID=5061 RepID=A2QJM2_ASPNC|nr:hypothetical protein An04g07555 [Aspergillus niger]CAK38912.1 hypothetical protein An04g07555 [Aspergillus niger]